MPVNNIHIEKRLWDSADQLRANSRLKSSEYSVPVLGLIFLRFADHRFSTVQQELEASIRREGRRRRLERLIIRHAACCSFQNKPASPTC